MRKLKQKQESGRKTMVKIQVQYLKKIKKHSWHNIPKQFRKMSDGISKGFSHTVFVKVEDIDTRDKLASVIRDHFGYGGFNVLFYNRYMKSSKYNPNFRCPVQRGKECKYHSEGYFVRTEKGLVLRKCKLYTRHKKGWSCRANRRFRPNWNTRAGLEITPYNLFGKQDFKYKWDKRKDKMYYFANWFWKGR